MIPLAGLTLVLAACDAGSDASAEAHLQRAQNYRQEGDVRAAVIELKNALQREPENAEARWQLGQAYLSLGNGSAAAKELERARELGYQGGEHPIELMQALLLQNEYEKVLATLDHTEGANANPHLLALRARAHLGLDQLDEAESAFRKVLELAPDAGVARLGLARVAGARGDAEEAERQTDLALETTENDAQAWLFKGQLALARNDYARAQAAFREVLALNEASVVARAGLARALLGLNEPEHARSEIDALAERDANAPIVKYLEALLAREQRDLEGAQRALREVLAMVPDHPPSLLLLGSIHFSRQEFEQAEELLGRLLAQAPRHITGAKLLAGVYVQQDRLDDAIAVLQRLEREHPDDPQVLAMLGKAYLKQDDAERGRDYLRRAVELAPDAPLLRTQLAAGYLAAGAAEEAVSELREVIEQNPEFVRADVLLVLTHLSNRDHELAFEAARALSEKHPDSAVPYNLMGVVREAQDDEQEARSLYERALEKQPEHTAAVFNLARMDYQAGETTAARERYEQVLERRENHSGALLALARIAADEGRTAASVDYLERARAANERFLAPRLLLAEYYLRQGQTEEALAVAEEAGDIAAGNPRVLIALGRARLATGRTQPAVSAFESLVEHDPESPAAHFQLGLARMQAGDTSGARGSLEKALELEGSYLQAKVALTNLALRSGELGQALEYARHIQEQHPDAVAGQILEGDAYMARGDYDQAARAYAGALERVQTSRLVIKLQAAKAGAGDVAGARAVLEGRLAEQPDDVAARLAFASLLHQTGDRAGAQQGYERVLETQPQNPIALNNLAWLYHEQGDQRALDLAEEAYRLVPERPEIADTYGWLLVQNEQVERGLRVLQRAVQESPTNGDIRYHLAASLAKAGERESARAELEALLASGQNFAEHPKAEQLLEELE